MTLLPNLGVPGWDSFWVRHTRSRKSTWDFSESWNDSEDPAPIRPLLALRGHSPPSEFAQGKFGGQ